MRKRLADLGGGIVLWIMLVGLEMMARYVGKRAADYRETMTTTLMEVDHGTAADHPRRDNRLRDDAGTD